MNKGSTALLMVFLMMAANVVYAEDWNIAKNVKRLERIAPDYLDDKPTDKKFLDVLDLTEKTRKDNELYAEAKRIAAMPALSQSKYMDSFLYYMLVRSTMLSSASTAEPDHWLGLLKGYEKSPHLLAAGLVHMKQMPKNSPGIRSDVQFLVDWIKAQKPDMKVRAPEYTRNMLMSYKPRVDFAEGDTPKLYKLSYYMASVAPIDGFLEDDTYIALLGQMKDGREDILAEMTGIYRKMGKRKEASGILHQHAMLRVNAKDFQKAKALLDDAVKLDPENAGAVKERDRIKLELTYQSLEPVSTPSQEKPEEQPAQQTEAPAPAEPPASQPAPNQ